MKEHVLSAADLVYGSKKNIWIQVAMGSKKFVILTWTDRFFLNLDLLRGINDYHSDLG